MPPLDTIARPAAGGHAPVAFDFRRTDTVRREVLRSMSAVHDLFARRTATAWGGALRAVVKVEEAAVEQATYDDFVASMPNPNVLAIVQLAPLPGPIVLELNVEMALTLIDRMLGGGASTSLPSEPRRLTDIEAGVLRHLLDSAIEALIAALQPLETITDSRVHLEYNPQLAQIVAPNERVLLFSYDVAVSQGTTGTGLFTLCYPLTAVEGLLETLQGQLGSDAPSARANAPDPAAQIRLADVSLPVHVRVDAGRVPARDLAGLRPGDVLALDHPADAPVAGRCGPKTLFTGHLGQRGRHRAVLLATSPADLAVPRPSASAPTEKEADDV